MLGLATSAVGVAAMFVAAWLVGKSKAESGEQTGQQQPDQPDEPDEWEKLSQEDREYLRRFFK